MNGATIASLYARIPLGVRLGLEPMRAAIATLGRPDRAFEIVHVAGTNGKGSVSAMTEAIARAAGKRTGLYTSPHLLKLNERIRIDGEPIDDAALAAHVDRALALEPQLSFFEVLTAAALSAFREAKVELAVLEVGLGGRLDATNVIDTPRAGAITRIALDHTDRLGATLVEIAREKAGIAKPGLDLVLGPMRPEVRGAIDAVAHAHGATTSSAHDDAEAVATAARAKLTLAGGYQRDNAVIAAALGARIGADTAARVRGLESARWPGRLETIATPEGPVLLDAAHNVDGAEALAAHLAVSAPAPEKTALVFGALADKDFGAMIDALAPHAARRFYVAPAAGPGRRPADLGAIAARHPGAVVASVSDALAQARAAQPELVVVAGSIYLVGEARAALLQLPRDPAVAL